MSRGQSAAEGLLRLPSLRQASEQCFTSSQFLAQDFRQVMVRPHTLQSLLGRKLLLPGCSRLVMSGLAVGCNGGLKCLTVRLDCKFDGVGVATGHGHGNRNGMCPCKGKDRAVALEQSR